jgi:4-hydroxybenzoate polyprenyltransferase
MAWDGFLKSLETDGGKLVVLLLMLLFLAGIAMILLLTGHTPQEAGRQMLVGAISSLLGILYGYLKSSGPTK